MNKIMIFTVILSIIYIGVFLIPGHVDKLALIPEKSNEIWRFITYSFTHLNTMHLIENLGGLFLITFIAKELKMVFSAFSSTYLSSGILSVIPLWLIIPFIALGSSNAIFGGFGSLYRETKRYGINNMVLFIPLIFVIFLKAGISYFNQGYGAEFILDFKQGLAHFFGLLFGMGFMFLFTKIKPIITKRKRHTLRVVSQ